MFLTHTELTCSTFQVAGIKITKQENKSVNAKHLEGGKNNFASI